MAPYVEREWGTKATELMWRVKALADPDGVLVARRRPQPRPGAHLRNLKTTPPIEESATTCVECGFCEPVCPSRDLTTTPRQRIVLRREIARQPSGSPVQEALLEELGYEALDTCAADGSCQLACPVGIDTGALVKELRAERHTERAERGGAGDGEALGRGRVGLAGGAAGRRPGGAADAQRAGAARAGEGSLPATTREGAAAVYVPSCTNRIFGGGPIDALVAVSARAGQPVWIPADVGGQLLRAAVELERLRRRPPPQGQRAGRAALGVERRGHPADRRRRRLLHRRDRRTGGGDAERGERRAPRGADDPRLGRLGPRPPAADASRSSARSTPRRSTRPAPPTAKATPGASAPSPRRSPTTSTSRRRRPAAASPATAASPTPS